MVGPPLKILIVDDDERLRALVARFLSDQGFSTKAAADSGEMDRLLARERFDLMVLDLMLPGEDGLAICRRLRAQNMPLPIIMLTARGDEVDRIVGLEMGADDYLPKPFNPRELVARIKAVLRRNPAHIPGAPSRVDAKICFGEFILDLSARVLYKNAAAIPLTSGEFSLLKALTAFPHQPLSRDRLMELARGREHEAFDRSIDVQISRLRKLLEVDAAHPKIIQTVWGFGYVFIPEADQ